MSIDPITIMAMLSTAVSVAGAASSASAEAGAAKYNAQVAKNNATVMEQNAQQSIFKAQQDAQDQDMQARAELGQYLAQAGASGFDAGAGSLLGRRRSLAELAAKDRGRIRHGGDVQAANFRQRGQGFTSEAGMQKRRASAALTSGSLAVGASLLTGASRVRRGKASRIRAQPVSTIRKAS